MLVFGFSVHLLTSPDTWKLSQKQVPGPATSCTLPGALEKGLIRGQGLVPSETVSPLPLPIKVSGMWERGEGHAGAEMAYSYCAASQGRKEVQKYVKAHV